jgi:hypothetical protein
LIFVERFIQCLDDLEDLIFAAPLMAEQLRRAMKRVLILLGTIGLQIGGVLLALTHPPLALAVVTLLTVGLLFRAVIIPMPQTISAG